MLSALALGSFLAAMSLAPADLAVVINKSDPLSEAIGSYYVRRRHIPPANVVYVRFDSHQDHLQRLWFLCNGSQILFRGQICIGE